MGDHHGIHHHSVPDPLREWVDHQVESGPYNDASAYVGELIRRDRGECDERETLIAELERGESSGTSERRGPEILEASGPRPAIWLDEALPPLR